MKRQVLALGISMTIFLCGCSSEKKETEKTTVNTNEEVVVATEATVATEALVEATEGAVVAGYYETEQFEPFIDNSTPEKALSEFKKQFDEYSYGTILQLNIENAAKWKGISSVKGATIGSVTNYRDSVWSKEKGYSVNKHVYDISIKGNFSGYDEYGKYMDNYSYESVWSISYDEKFGGSYHDIKTGTVKIID